MDKELSDILCKQLDRLYKFAYNRTRDAYKAEDLTQDIVLSAIRSYHKIKDKNKILPWLWGVARNVYMRSVKPSREFPAEENFIIDKAGISYETPEDIYIESDEICNVRRAVSYLAKNYRDVAVMHYIEEKDYNTISRELSIPLSSVKWRLNQSKSQIREELETMEYMNSGYRKAQELFVSMGGWVGKPDWRGNYEGADRALETLLAKNIAIFAYQKPVTVTEISSALGTSADYVEDIIEKMVETRTLEKSGNKYQTNFPILDGAQTRDIYRGNLAFVKEKAVEILEMLYSLKADIQALGFHGCQKDFDNLILTLITIVGKETKGNIFDTSKLPFNGTDKSWYILGKTEDIGPEIGSNGGGLSWNIYDSLDKSAEYYIFTPLFKDRRDKATANVLRNLYYGDEFFGHDTMFISEEAHNIALLIEEGKIEKNGDEYIIKVPVFDENKNEYRKLVAVLSPVIELSNKLQEALNKRSFDTVRKYIPKRLNSDEFFGTFCANYVVEAALFDLLHDKNITFTG
ncbi:MAG: sigma-70 family RNA polymerase sigma factor, partial [Oscillospiraceae bacterium]|nr:sigma-70 family RNA polymerase sigma factor [Oscillospiraceae bacterium]